MKNLLTVKDLARFMKCTESSIYQKVSANKIPYINFAGMIRFDPDMVPGYNEKSPDQKAEGKNQL